VPKHKERIGTKQIQTFTILFQNSANYRYLLYWNNPENFSSLSFLIRLYGCFILVHDQSPYKNLLFKKEEHNTYNFLRTGKVLLWLIFVLVLVLASSLSSIFILKLNKKLSF